MAKDTPNKPEDNKNAPTGDKKSNNKIVPDKEPGKADTQAADQQTEPAEQDKKLPEVPAPEKEVDGKTEPPIPDKPPDDEKLKQEQEALLKALDEKAADWGKKNPPAKKKADEKIKPPPADKKLDEKQPREARPPKGPKETSPPPEPKKPPEPIEAPRPGEKEEIIFIKLNELFPFKDHPFGVRDDAEMRAMVESVKDKGVTQPAIVRPREDGGYELVSGHRRQKASELAGYTDMPCIVRHLTDEQAITQMVEDNTNQRDSILPSERAKALKMQLDAIKRQGVRDGSGGNGQRSNEIVAERNNMNAKQVQRYIKLNDLVPELLKMADEGTLKFTPAVELAFVNKKNQQYIAMTIESQQSTPNLSQAQRMRELDQSKTLNPDVIDGIMLEEKKEADKVILSSQELSQYFGKDKTPREMKDTIIDLLEQYKAEQEISAPEKKSAEQEK